MFLLAAVLLACATVTVKVVLDRLAFMNAESQRNPPQCAWDSSKSNQRPSTTLATELSIIIPAYNEEERLPTTLQETLSYLQRRQDRQGTSFTFEVIVVDDGSSDGTMRVVESFVGGHGGDVLKLLHLPRNHGKGYAVKSGMHHARGRLLLMMDADGATKVSDIERLEAKLLQLHSQNAINTLSGLPHDVLYNRDSLGFVLGSRAHTQESVVTKRTALRNFLTRCFHILVMLVIGNQIRDTQCGFKLFTRAAAQRLYGNQRLQRWCFDVELVLLAQQLKIPMAEVQVTWTEIPGSKIRLTSMVHMALELFLLKAGYCGGLWKIRAG